MCHGHKRLRVCIIVKPFKVHCFKIDEEFAILLIIPRINILRWQRKMYDQNLYGGRGVVDGEGCSSEGCLNWGGGGVGSLRGLSKISQSRGWVKAKIVLRRQSPGKF